LLAIIAPDKDDHHESQFMAVYPDTPEFSALDTPLGKEHSLQGLAIEGALPPEIEGEFFRAVPDPAFPPMRSTRPVHVPSATLGASIKAG
jgi:carotenoid cleavage dioxygenase-like enzyme